uniref:Uncharacterized protein n=1 Tax=Biomphalaria glabrata TaxID=6526 RepID=A0A2C9JKL3_BIOGL
MFMPSNSKVDPEMFMPSNSKVDAEMFMPSNSKVDLEMFMPSNSKVDLEMFMPSNSKVDLEMYDLTGECDPNDPQKVMDADIVHACHETNGSKYQIYSFYDGQYYKNIFCYICGTMLYPFEMMDWWCFDSFVDGDMNLYRLLVNLHGRDQESSSKHSVCNDTFWPAPNVRITIGLEALEFSLGT